MVHEGEPKSKERIRQRGIEISFPPTTSCGIALFRKLNIHSHCSCDQAMWCSSAFPWRPASWSRESVIINKIRIRLRGKHHLTTC